MTPERLRQIEELFHAASERSPDSRAEFLIDACAGDEGLFREVHSLLAARDGTLLIDAVPAATLIALAARNLEGRKLGPYVLGPLLGSGGMGDVYRAHDEKLGRYVAIKILPEPLKQDGSSNNPASPQARQRSERLARFEREARVLAALSHPNVAAIYGFEEGDSVRGLVLELVDGITLHDKLAGGPLPVADALAIGRQIAEALHAAHQKGIVHRDLKPANIKITSRGVVKVLDFGLAKVALSEAAEPGQLSILETEAGVVMGTVAYMSPEQARGLVVDKRTDIWAFGCVLYEALTGIRAFKGDSAADVMGAITTGEPDWQRLPEDTPRRIRDLLRRCLTKDPDRRLHDVADARIEIDDAIRESGEGEGPVQQSVVSRARRLAPWLVTAIAATALAAIWMGRPPSPGATPTPSRLSIALPADVSLFAIGRGSSVAVSPDGRNIVYSGIAGGRRQLYLRSLTGFDSRPIEGTENAASPFFSPDGRWIGFIDNVPGGSLKKVQLEGGPALTIVDSRREGIDGLTVQAATWGPNDTILLAAFSPGPGGLWRVAASGGVPERLTTATKGELFHTWPELLPGGNAVLYTVWTNTGFDGGRIMKQSLAGAEPVPLVERASYGRVLADGRRAWLVYARPEGLHAAPFDLERLQVTGPDTPVLDGVAVNLSGGAHYSVSTDGLVAYVPGGLDEVNKTALWVSRDGTVTEIGVISGLGFQYRLSPDSRRLVRPNAVGPHRDLWVDDLEHGGTPTRLTAGSVVNDPIWHPDGQRVIYTSGVPNGNLFWRPADGSGVEERLTTSAWLQAAGSVSRDGATLAYSESTADGLGDLWVMPLQPPRQPRLLLGTRFSEWNPMFSADGRWLAYQSNRTGTSEIYLTSIAGDGRQIPISKGGGWNPIWSPDGRELYYRTDESPRPRGHMMAVTIDTTGAEPTIGTPRALFPYSFQGEGDVARDGRFLLLKQTPQESPSRVIQLVLNWFEELEGRLR